jgi:hypothetical protein
MVLKGRGRERNVQRKGREMKNEKFETKLGNRGKNLKLLGKTHKSYYNFYI